MEIEDRTVLSKIYNLQKEKFSVVENGLFKVSTHLQQVDKRLFGLEANLDLIRMAHLENGKHLGLIEQRCEERKKKLSQLTKSLTLPHESSWQSYCVIVSLIVAFGGFGVALFSLL